MHPVWKLQAFDRVGAIIGTITRNPGGPIIFEGTTDAMALCLPDLRRAASFFTDPDAIGRAAYEEMLKHLPSALTCLSWDTLKANSLYEATIKEWIAIGQAAINAPTQ